MTLVDGFGASGHLFCFPLALSHTGDTIVRLPSVCPSYVPAAPVQRMEPGERLCRESSL